MNENPKPLISVVIRTKNEEKTIEKLLKFFGEQSYKNIEINIVDNLSTDKTLEICKKYKTNIYTISEFTHTKSCNLGVKVSNGKYIFFTNGHSLPLHKDMFSQSVELMEGNNKVAGAFGLYFPYKHNSNIVEKVVGLFYKHSRHKKLTILADKNYWRYPLLHTISSLIRKDLLEQNPYDERLTKGGEDYLFSRQMVIQGYQIAYDPKLDVYHSHGGSIKDGFNHFYGYFRIWRDVEKMVKK